MVTARIYCFPDESVVIDTQLIVFLMVIFNRKCKNKQCRKVKIMSMLTSS